MKPISFVKKMGLIGLLLGLLASSTPVFAQHDLKLEPNAANPGPVNLDFEQGTPGEVPPGWTNTTGHLGFPARLSEENPKSGKYCAKLSWERASSLSANEIGVLLQGVDATPFRGKRIRYRAAVRVNPGAPNGRAQMWMRVDLPNNRRGFFDNMDDRPIRSADWRTYEIIGAVDPTATYMVFGLFIGGASQAFIDDVSIEILPTKPSPLEPPAALAGQEADNVVAFARLTGYVRFFHPSTEAGRVNWEQFTVEGIRAVQRAKNKQELSEILTGLFTPIAPMVQVFPTEAAPPLPEGLALPAGVTGLRVVTWSHYGVGLPTGSGTLYKSGLKTRPVAGNAMPEGFVDPRKPYRAELGGGLACRIPLTLYADEQGTLPRGTAPPPNSETELPEIYSMEDRASRMANIILAWNVFQHFYPYFDVVKGNWLKTLSDSLKQTATDADLKAFHLTLQRFMAALNDGHAAVGGVLEPALALPLDWEIVEGKLIVVQVADPAVGLLNPGDEVVGINQKDALQALREQTALISGATPQWKQLGALFRLRSGPPGSNATLVIRPVGKSQTEQITLPYGLNYYPAAPKPPVTAELEPGIFYFDIDRATDDDFLKLLPKLTTAKGVIFDLRGYPSRLSPGFLQHFTDKPITTAIFNVPLVSTPDHKQMNLFQNLQYSFQPRTPRIGGKIVFITNGRAISYSETVMGIIEAHKLGEIVGEPTAGTNGSVNPFTIIGGYRLSWTGMQVRKHDGTTHHGVGIRPTVPSSRTVKGVAEGRDEQLEKALEVVKRP